MSKRSPISNGYITSPRIAIYWYAGCSGIAGPFVGVAMSTPIWHVFAATSYLPGRVTDTLAVIHTPTIYHAILGGVAPNIWISVVAIVSSHNCVAREVRRVNGGLLSPEDGNFLEVLPNLGI